MNGSSTGVLKAFAYPRKALYSFNNYGYAVRQVVLQDIDGDGKAEVLIASDTGYVYALDDRGEPKWQTDLGAAVLALATVKRGNGVGLAGASCDGLVVAQRDGFIRVLDLRGNVVAGVNLGSSIKLLKCADLNGGGSDEIIAVDDERRCVVLK